MSSESFKISGSDLLRKADGKIPSVSKEVFVKPKGGGGGLGRASKPVPTNSQPDEDLIPDAPKPEPKVEAAVKLSNPKFLVSEGHFEEKVPFSVDADLPESLKHVKRVIITAWSLPTQGEKQQAFSKDFYVDDNGKVTGEIELRRPSKQNGKEVETCSFFFTAKHRDSKQVESPKLKVKEKFGGDEELILELPASDELKNSGTSFELKSKNGAIITKVEVKNGEEKAGIVILKFVKLDANLSYSLNKLDSNGKTEETIFKDLPFGKWEESAT